MGSTKPLRTFEVDMNLDGSIQPWLVSSDDGSLSDIVNSQDPDETRTLPKLELQAEYRGPGKITAAALQIFSQEEASARASQPSKYLPDVLPRACRNFEKCHEFEAGEAFKDWIDIHSLTVAGTHALQIVRRSSKAKSGGSQTA